MAGCTYVLHVASPFPTAAPKDRNELIRPAVDGTLHVLRACHAAHPRPKVHNKCGSCVTGADVFCCAQRIVVTSSFAAIGYGQLSSAEHPFTEENWTVVGNSPLLLAAIALAAMHSHVW